MTELTLHPSAIDEASRNLEQEIVRLEAQLAERRSELVALQHELREFKARYTQIVGARLAELAEVEQAIKEAEARLLGVTDEEAEDEPADTVKEAPAQPVKTTLRKLFWSVARMFHPDHAAGEEEARRRHAIMAEANRAYREGDVESLHTLLGDDNLQFYCAAGAHESDEDLAARLLRLREELRTIEFGIKRVHQDGFYRIKRETDEAARAGRDSLAEEAERLRRQITKARRRLDHLT